MDYKLNITGKAAFFVVISMLLLSACTPTSTNDLSNDDDKSGYPSDLSRIEWANNDIISMVDEAGSLYNGSFLRTTGPGTAGHVGYDTDHVVHTLNIQFGDKDVVCLDGRKRRGTINVTFFNHYKDTAQVHAITFDNYFIDGNQVTGTIKTIRVDTTLLGNWFYTVLASDTMNISQDPLKSMLVAWNGTLVRRWIGGANTNDRNDDVFSISGSATLTRPNGHSFTCDISAPLQFNINWNYAVSGVVDVTGYLSPMRVLNYGQGNPDAVAQLNIGTNVYTITLIK